MTNKSNRTTKKKVELSAEHFDTIKDANIRLDVMKAVEKLYKSGKFNPVIAGKKKHNVKRKVVEMTYDEVSQFEIPKIQRYVPSKHFEDIAIGWDTYKQAPILGFKVDEKTVIPDGQNRVKGFMSAWTMVDMYNRENGTTHDLPTIWVELMELDKETLDNIDFQEDDSTDDFLEEDDTGGFVNSIFLGRNSVRPLSAADKFAAMLALGNQKASDIDKVCKELGLTYTTNARNNSGGVVAISALNAAYNYSARRIVNDSKKSNSGKDATTYNTRMVTIKTVLEMMIDVWGGGIPQEAVIDRMLLSSLVLFVYNHLSKENKVNLEKLKQMLLNKYMNESTGKMRPAQEFRINIMQKEAVNWAERTENTTPPGMDSNTIRMYGIVWTQLYNSYANPEQKLDKDTKIFYTGSKKKITT